MRDRAFSEAAKEGGEGIHADLRTPRIVRTTCEVVVAYIERQLLQAIRVIARRALPAIRQRRAVAFLLLHHRLLRRRVTTVLAPLLGLGHFPAAASHATEITFAGAKCPRIAEHCTR